MGESRTPWLLSERNSVEYEKEEDKQMNLQLDLGHLWRGNQGFESSHQPW